MGKTTVCLKVADALREEGYTVGGIYCPEVREGPRRVGFDIVDLTRDDRYPLARVGHPGPRVGRYGVFVENLEKAASAILEALESKDVVVVDEVGPMELKSKAFEDAVRRAADHPTPCIFVVHARSRHPLVLDLRERREDVEVYEVTERNRDDLPDIVMERLIEWLEA